MKEIVKINGWVATDPSGVSWLYTAKPFKDEKWWTGPGDGIQLEDLPEELKEATKKEPREVEIIINSK